MPTGDGYVTDEELERIATWPHEQGWRELLAYVHDCWWAADWGWSAPEPDEEGLRYQISTGGWSGNESIIDALQGNEDFWHECWYSTRRGGHYIFTVREVRDATTKTNSTGEAEVG